MGFALKNQTQEVIGVNSGVAMGRQRFVIAHCMGHLKLHSKPLVVDYSAMLNRRDEIPTMGTRFEEAQANDFATSMLMPQAMLIQHLAAVDLLANPRESLIKDITSLFQVSKDVVIYRLVDLGILLG